MLETSFILPRGNLPGSPEPVGDLIELAQHHIAKMADLMGVPDCDLAVSIAAHKAAFLVVLDDERRPEASAVMFYDPADRGVFRTLYAVLVADAPDYCFRDLAARAEIAAKADKPGPFQYLDIMATGAVGLDGYSIRESEPGRVVVGRLILAN